MSDHYNDEVSKHYATYRPPLHQMILSANLAKNDSFQYGLDIGCGTGVSTIALAEYCHSVLGVDPSDAMIRQTKSDDRIHYRVGFGESIPLADNTVDIVTFAGSLSYAKSDALVAEIKRVCGVDALVLVYDFEVLLTDTMKYLGITQKPRPSSYDHAVNFNDYNGLVEQAAHQTRLQLNMTSEELAHVLFSSSKRYASLVELFGPDDTFATVVKMLEKKDNKHCIDADIYYSRYLVNQR
ncbi:class I SAM-dependent methyltransferase [Photobacterium sanctipauli]|uniref:Class I SAM-dependent methyltransferase n=1 Tax=Photobacterium sanctipauli TaxID=1342794 RepID=A0A2T3NZX1_9GAMM|nr:class I SAM-dependent methyltransferase [Photobacterium sanctipauli]PSW21815.1 class I SAM-dependent methyltransferase [Photobacterium sanctipauli]